MKKFIYAVYDNKAMFHASPFTSINDATAVREFAAAVNDPMCAFNQNPSDYNLFRIGEYDDETAIITSCHPVNLGLASNFISPVVSKLDGSSEDVSG